MSTKFRVIIAGSRSFDNYRALTNGVTNIIDELLEEQGLVHADAEIEIVSGCARGADQLGEKFAREHGYELIRFPADWNQYGKKAGYIRNTEMAKYATSDDTKGVLIAFWDGQSKGTKHMIDIALRYGMKVYVGVGGKEWDNVIEYRNMLIDEGILEG